MTRRVLFWCLAAAAALFAAGWAWSLRWTCDDAFISFRYAWHLVEGHGLRFNLDPLEPPVEGYSNFLWTLWLALGMALGATGDSIEAWSEAWGTLCHGGTVLLLAWAAQAALGSRAAVPVAAVAYALHHHAASLAPAGLETALFVLLFVAMAVGTSAARAAKGAAGPALLGVLGALTAATRPDGALPCAVAFALLLLDALRSRRWRALLGYALPLLLICGPLLLWRHAYYGQWVPNTFFAKAGGDPYPGQGWIYLREYLRCYWVLVPAALLFRVACVRRRPAGTALVLDLRAPLLANVAAYLAFVLWVGGDFMFARFLLPVTPLVLLGAELCAGHWRPLWRGALAAALGAGMLARVEAPWFGEFDPQQNPYGFSDNRAISVKDVVPGLTRADGCRIAGRYLAGLFEGLDVRLGIAGGTANFAYRSRVPVAVECAAGLTDAFIAHLPVGGRGQPGHERNYTLYPGYLQRRGVQFMTELSFKTGSSADVWRDVSFPSTPVALPARLVTYDRRLMDELKRRDAGIRFVPFEQVLDRYIAELPGKDKELVRRDFAGFRDFYFDHNEDPARLRAFEEFLRP